MAIFGVLGPEVCTSGSRPAFRMRFFATNLGGTMSWGLKPCFSALESRFMTPLFILPSNYQLVVSGGGLSIMLMERSKVSSEPKKRDFFPAKNPVDARWEGVRKKTHHLT